MGIELLMSHSEALFMLGMSLLQNEITAVLCCVGTTWAEYTVEGSAWLQQLYPVSV